MSKNKLFAICSAMLVLLLIFSGCSAYEKLNIEADINYFGEGSEFRVFNQKGNIEVARNGNTALFFDDKKGGITLSDLGGAKLWSSLPSKENVSAADFYVKIHYNNKTYLLDTAANSAANEAITYELGNNSITVKYTMSADGISVILPVTYSLTGSFLSVGIDMSECEVSDGVTVLSIGFLPFMGSLHYSDSSDLKQLGDYFLVPDAAGAVMYTAVESETEKSSVFSVYGKQLSEEAIPSYVAAYGIKNLNSTLSVTVTSAAENALIKVFRSNYDSDGINRIYPEFIITPISANSGKVTAANSFLGKIEVCYEASTGENVDYITMAVSVRQALINAGLIEESVSNNEYPMFVSVINSTDGTKNGVLTSFQQTENLLGLLKGKGVNNIELVLQGAFSGGLVQKNNSSLKVLSSLGGMKDLKSLCEYASSQQLNVFGGISFMSSAASNDSLKDLNGNIIEAETHTFVQNYDKKSLLRYKQFSVMSDTASEILKITSDTGLSGVCIVDSDKSAFTEKSKNSGDYSYFTKRYNDSISSVSTDSLIMIDGCNVNIIKNADYIRNISFDTAIQENEYYKSVPFIPAVLHSSYVYTGTPINDAEISKLRLLKYVEYGAAVHYEWCFNSSVNKYYANSINEAVDFYEDCLTRLGDLSSKRIVGHFMYEDGVYCTEYDGGTKVYVNYNNYSVLLGNVTVMPYDFLRVG